MGILLRRRTGRILLCCQVALLSAQAWAGSGTTSAAFLRLGQGARAAAMGNAFTAVADDVSATYWNPAGLSTLKTHEISAERTLHIQDIAMDRLSYGHPFGQGAGAARQAWGMSTVYLQQNGIEQRSQNTAQPESTFGASDFAFGLSYARNLSALHMPATSLGISARTIQQRIAGYSARSMSFDAGVLSQWGPFKFGLAASNLGPDMKFLNEKYPLPATFRFGTAVNLRAPITLAFGVEKTRGESGMAYQAGSEFHLSGVLDLRAGYLGLSNQTKRAYHSSGSGSAGGGNFADGFTGMAGGLGFHIYNYSLDYAFTPYGDLGVAHKITLGAKF